MKAIKDRSNVSKTNNPYAFSKELVKNTHQVHDARGLVVLLSYLEAT